MDVDRTEDKWRPLFDLVQEQLARKAQTSMFLDPSTDLYRKIQALTPWQITNVQLAHLPKAKRVRPGMTECHRASVLMTNEDHIIIETEYTPDAQAPRERFVYPVRWAIFILGHAPGEPKEPSPAAPPPRQPFEEGPPAEDLLLPALQQEGLVRQDFAGECWFVGPPLTSGQKKLAPALVRMHRNLGHPRKEDFVRALAQQDRLEQDALVLARRLRCATCERTRRPLPPRPSSLKSTPAFNTKLSLDFVYLHDSNGEKFHYLHILDPAGAFNVFALVKSREPSEALDVFTTSWANWAGYPAQMRLDRDGSFEGVFYEKLTDLGLNLDYIPAEAHWQAGDVEAFNRAFRNVANKLIDEYQIQGEQDMRMLGASVAASLNDKVRMSGASANQWVFGKNPTIPGDLLNLDGKVETLHGLQRDEQLRVRTQIRARADALLSEYRVNEALQKAVTRQSRPPRQRYEPGELVAFWRNVKKKKGKLVQPGWFRGTIIGPDKGSEEGQQSNYWVSSNGRCILVSLEQLRPAFGTELWPVSEEDLQWLEDNMPEEFYDERGDPPLPDDIPPDALHEEFVIPAYDDEVEMAEELRPAEVQQVPPELAQPPDPMQTSPAPSDATQPHPESPLLTRAPGTPVGGLLQNALREPDPKRQRLGLTPPASSAVVPDSDEDVGSVESQRPAHETESMPDAEIKSALVTALSKDKWELSDDGQWLVRRHHLPRRQLFSPLEVPGLPVQAQRLGSERHTRYRYVNYMSSFDQKSVDVMSKDSNETPHSWSDTWRGNGLETAMHYDWTGSTWFRVVAAAKKIKGRRVSMTRKEQKALDREIPYHLIPEDEREAYHEALCKEWSTWERYAAVKVLDKAASEAVEKYVHKNRILDTRVCYRNKNAAFPWMPPKHKARHVCRGDRDPDITSLRRDAPTMSRMAMMVLLQVAAAMPGWFLFNADITGAFLQGDQSLSSRKEALYLRQPREGLPGLQKGQLMLVVRGIFGLANSPRLFWRHLRDTLLKIGFRQSTLDRAVFFYYKEERLVLVLGAHVDDLLGTGQPGAADEVLAELRATFDFGAWADSREDEVLEYGGKQIRKLADGTVLLNQEKFIRATSVTAIPKWRTSTPNSNLLKSEMTELRSVGGCLHWVVGQTRPDLAAGTSLHMSGTPTVTNLLELNKLLKEAKASEGWALRFRPIDLEKARIVVFSDSSFANAEGLRSQAGYLVFVTGDQVCSVEGDVASLVDWRSHKIKRQCRSTLAAETMSLDAAVDSGLYTRELLAEMLVADYVPAQSGRLPPDFLPMHAATDCRSLYDLLVKDGSLSTTQEKRLAIDLGGLRETAAEFDEQCEQLTETYKWVDTKSQLADHLTKPKPPMLLRELLDKGKIALQTIESTDSHEL